jgi:tRNA A-37 threonylcarbamoyl transferase component Bud32
MSCARRAIKIFSNYEDHQHIRNQRRVAEYARGLEKLSGFALTPRYYHGGVCFIDDDLGNYYIAQEFVQGDTLTMGNIRSDEVEKFLGRLKQVHDATNLVIGDWEESNILVEEGGRIRLIDADLGTNKGSEGSGSADLRAAKNLLEKFVR